MDLTASPEHQASLFRSQVGPGAGLLPSEPTTFQNGFHCRFCGNSYVRKGDLTRHENSHTEKRVYPCKARGCSRTEPFLRKDNATTHVSTVHKTPRDKARQLVNEWGLAFNNCRDLTNAQQYQNRDLSPLQPSTGSPDTPRAPKNVGAVSRTHEHVPYGYLDSSGLTEDYNSGFLAGLRAASGLAMPGGFSAHTNTPFPSFDSRFSAAIPSRATYDNIYPEPRVSNSGQWQPQPGSLLHASNNAIDQHYLVQEPRHLYGTVADPGYMEFTQYQGNNQLDMSFQDGMNGMMGQAGPSTLQKFNNANDVNFDAWDFDTMGMGNNGTL